MSLSFVSKSVQTAGDDGKFQEKEIDQEEKEAEPVEKKTLYQQLIENRERIEAEREEKHREELRGAMALDAEDAAHLDALEEKKREKDRQDKSREEEELALFKAAQEYMQDKADEDVVEKRVNSQAKKPTPKREAPVRKKPVAPIVLKKRRKDEPKQGTQASDEAKAKDDAPPMGGLLAGYGSSSDED